MCVGQLQNNTDLYVCVFVLSHRLLQRLHHGVKLSQDLKTSNVQKDKRVDDLTKEIRLLSTQVCVCANAHL